MFRTTAVVAIGSYQRYVSPYKGYRCAHRALTGGPSCSAFAIRAIRLHGVLRGLALLRKRFEACTASARVLAAIPIKPREPRPRSKPEESPALTPGKPGISKPETPTPASGAPKSESLPPKGCNEPAKPASGPCTCCGCPPWVDKFLAW